MSPWAETGSHACLVELLTASALEEWALRLSNLLNEVGRGIIVKLTEFFGKLDCAGSVRVTSGP